MSGSATNVTLRRDEHGRWRNCGGTLFSIEIRDPWNWENLGNLWGILKISINILSTNDLNPSFGVEHGPSCHKRR